MTFSADKALTLAAEAEASLDANARGDWPTSRPDLRALASMLRAAVARVEDLEAETRAVRMTEADLVRMPMSDLDHHKAELLAMLTDRDSLRAKLAEVEADRDKWRHIAKVQDEKAHAFLEQRDSARRELGRLGDKRREAEHRASRAEANAREYMSQLAASRVDLSQAEAALGEMTKARDEACRLLEGCTNELAEHEDDPSMLDGHRTRITELRSVGKENP
jgi:chromosome segregation ATPase